MDFAEGAHWGRRLPARHEAARATTTQRHRRARRSGSSAPALSWSSGAWVEAQLFINKTNVDNPNVDNLARCVYESGPRAPLRVLGLRRSPDWGAGVG
jgi:hypothetical protein